MILEKNLIFLDTLLGFGGGGVGMKKNVIFWKYSPIIGYMQKKKHYHLKTADVTPPPWRSNRTSGPYLFPPIILMFCGKIVLLIPYFFFIIYNPVYICICLESSIKTAMKKSARGRTKKKQLEERIISIY